VKRNSSKKPITIPEEEISPDCAKMALLKKTDSGKIVKGPITLKLPYGFR